MMFKSFFKLLMMAVMCSMVEDDGIPSGGDEFAEGDPASNNSVPQTQSGETVTLTREQIDELMAPVHEIQQEKAINTAVSDIKGRYGDFELSKVHDHLKELHKTNPEEAAKYNNPLGWELLWSRDLAPKQVNADAVNSGRNVDSDGGRQAVIDKIQRGEGSRFDAEDLLLKYL